MSNNVNCPCCDFEIDTTDWTENFTFNDEVFEVNCSKCEEYFSVKVDITTNYEVYL